MSLGTENEQIEFKKSTSELKEGIQSLSSMLNKSGKGVIYFGVKNNGEIIGQLIGENTLRDISQAIANNIKPQIIPTIEAIYLEEKLDKKNQAFFEKSLYLGKVHDKKNRENSIFCF